MTTIDYTTHLCRFQANQQRFNISPTHKHRASEIIAEIDRCPSLQIEVPSEIKQKLHQIMRGDNSYFKMYGIEIEIFIKTWEAYCGV